jgi:hypothetical protein
MPNSYTKTQSVVRLDSYCPLWGRRSDDLAPPLGLTSPRASFNLRLLRGFYTKQGKTMKKVGLFLAVLATTGCASSTTQYYEAVAQAAQANAAASQAKFDALSKIAAAGDGQAASAAVMALALTQTATIAPVPQQSQAIQWASILATPVTSLGMMWMQADSAKTMAQYGAEVDLARISADATTQQALYGSFVGMNESTASVASNIDYTPFVDGMVTLGTAGISGAVDLGNAGLDSNVAISGAAITGLVDLGNAGLDSTVAMGTAGLDAATTLGTAGLTSAVTLGTAGMTGIADVSLAGYENMLNMDAANNNLFSGVWTNYQSSLQSILDSAVTCSSSTNADGVLTVTCE